MTTVFVAFGEPEQRATVLGFAAKQATASGYSLYVYHIHESEEPAQSIRAEAERIITDAPGQIDYDIDIDQREEFSDLTNVSRQKRLTDAIFSADRDFEYVVMGDIERDRLENFSHASLTRAVLERHAIPVLLVPV